MSSPICMDMHVYKDDYMYRSSMDDVPRKTYSLTSSTIDFKFISYSYLFIFAVAKIVVLQKKFTQKAFF